MKETRPLCLRFVICNVLFLFIITKNLAQQQASFRGSVVENNIPIEFVTVYITSTTDTTKIIKQSITDSLGQFNLNAIPFGNYVLKAQMIGFTTAKIQVALTVNNSRQELNPIELRPSQFMDAVEIVSHKDLIQKTPQGFIINAKDNLTQAGGSATDLLRNTPTVVVDAEGGITIRGKSPLILINGRNSNLANTDRIPASSIESIEIINNPSAQYDADADGGIINITLKKTITKGTNGSVALGAGYGAKPRFNSAFNLNHNAGKWNFGISYDNRYAARTRYANSLRTNYMIPLLFNNNQTRNDDRNEITHNIKCNIDFNLNEKNSFSFEALGNIDNQHNYESLTTLIQTQADTFNFKNNRFSDELGKEQALELAFNYTKKFNKKGQKLQTNISTSPNIESENTSITTQGLYQNNDFLGLAYLQQTSNSQFSNVSNVKLDYLQPLVNNGFLETGYKLITRLTKADYKNKYYQNNEFVTNVKSSSLFNFQEQVHAAYLQYRNSIGKGDSLKLKYDVGLRAEQVFNNGEVANQNIVYQRNYFNFFPTANAAYYINKNDFLKLSFTRRINRPSLGQLNPFTDITDSLNQHSGNPYLKPELINALEFGYNKEWKKISFNSNLFFRYATNIIRQYIVLQNNGIAVTKPNNLGNATTYGAESIVSVYPTNFWNFNLSASLFQQNINGSNVSSDLVNNVLSWYGKLINNFSVWENAKLQVIANYNSPTATVQGQSTPIYNIDMGFQQKVFKNKAALSLVLTDVFNTQRKGVIANTTDFHYQRNFKIDTRAVVLTFAYSFGTKFKEELLENKFLND